MPVRGCFTGLESAFTNGMLTSGVALADNPIALISNLKVIVGPKLSDDITILMVERTGD